MLDKLKLCTPVKSLTFKFDAQGLSVENLEEDAEVVLADLLRVVENMQVHLFTRRKRTPPRFNLKDFLVENLFLESLLFAGSTRVSPCLHVNFLVVRHFEFPVGLHTTDILQSERDPAWLRSILDRELSKVP